MKNKFYILFLFVIHYSTLYSQNKTISVLYNTVFNGTVFPKGESKEREYLSSTTAGTEDKIKTLVFKLIADDNKSIFNVIQEMPKDNETEGEVMGKIVAGYNDVFYRDNLNKKLISDKVVVGKRYKINETFDGFQWELTNDTKEIQGYKCLLAKTKLLHLNVYAWYCPAIPYAFGPREFGGLPGLILELQRGDLVFQATKIDFDSKEKIDFDLTKFNIIEKSELDRILAKIREQFLNRKE